MENPRQSWEAYERMIARLIADQITTGLCVTPNARIFGKISGRSRQIDVLIEARHDTDNTRRIIVDAKKRRRKIYVTDVEAFLGLMKDANATHGYLVSPAGYTKAAERRAQMTVSIRIVPVDRLENFDPSTWPRCRDSRCRGGRIFWDGYPELSLRLHPVESSTQHGPILMRFVHYAGKCDRCGLFHVWCTRCDEILAVPHRGNDDGHQCSCNPPWFWLASVEEDVERNKSAELHAVLETGEVITVDRRSL
jgi:Restriction endonuclease